ncbi:MAG: hypothetical protein KME54_15355 [Tolypothrix brevis GSE-NOS-MK-07-07A]|jgi:hypothetical protein|nr:hypothetical protein [Tolypothrix brevis GSE-NOS-MK-07-07A]
MQKFCNRIIIALHLYNRQPKQFGIIHTPLMQAKKTHFHPVENTCFIAKNVERAIPLRLYRRFEDAIHRVSTRGGD